MEISPIQDEHRRFAAKFPTNNHQITNDVDSNSKPEVKKAWMMKKSPIP
jgi:hypothetical protein